MKRRNLLSNYIHQDQLKRPSLHYEFLCLCGKTTMHYTSKQGCTRTTSETCTPTSEHLVFGFKSQSNSSLSRTIWWGKRWCRTSPTTVDDARTNSESPFTVYNLHLQNWVQRKQM